MRVTSIKTIRLSPVELKEAIRLYVGDTDTKLADHIAFNVISCDFDQNGDFVVSIDGEIEDEDRA
jgi:hypothetical protein